MSFIAAIRSVLSKYATFTGRAPRSEYWWWALFYLLLMVVAAGVDGAVIAPALGLEMFAEEGGQPVSLILSLLLLLPYLAVGVRRLHDINRSGWWLLIGLVPIVGAIVLIYWAVQRGTEGSNDFGAAVI